MSATTPQRVLLLGGTSEIGLAILRRLACDGPIRPVLVGRDRERLAQTLAQLEHEGCAPGDLAVLDAAQVDGHQPAIDGAFDRAGGFELVVLAIGVLGAQAGLDADPQEALEVMRVTFEGCASLLLACLRRLRAQGGGTVVVLSSVAGERVRADNAVYGAAKAGLDGLAQGLGDAVAADGVRVMVVRPGFVTTRMTAGLARAPLSTTPEVVARATVRGLAGRADTVWVPGALRPVLMVLRHLPRSVFRRLAP